MIPFDKHDIFQSELVQPQLVFSHLKNAANIQNSRSNKDQPGGASRNRRMVSCRRRSISVGGKLLLVGVRDEHDLPSIPKSWKYDRVNEKMLEGY